MTLKIKCDCDGGKVSYDNEAGFAVEHDCRDCNGKGFHLLQTVPFSDFAKAFESISGTPVYNEKFASDECMPFEFYPRWSILSSHDMQKITSASESLGLEYGIQYRMEGLVIYFVNK